MTALERSDLANVSEVIAHELRTPLAVVTVASETLLERSGDLDPDQVADLLRVINRNARLAALLLNRLGLARDVEQGTVLLTLDEVDLVALVRDSVSDLSEVVLGAHPVTVTTAEPFLVRADDTALREIVFNLLSNAAKYSPDGAAVEIHVTQEGAHAQLRVRDHGAGVAPADRDRVFDEYQQIDPRSPGVGLGLYISRGLAVAHGGDLSINVAVDVGSEFCLDLPLDGPPAPSVRMAPGSDAAMR